MKVDSVNIWYSEKVKKWSVCFLLRRSDGFFVRMKKQFDTYDEAVEWFLKQ